MQHLRLEATETLPATLGTLTRLSNLRLGCEKLSGMPAAVAQLPALRILSLCQLTLETELETDR